MRLHDKEFELFIQYDQILIEIARMGNELNRDYFGRKPLFIAVLKGSFMFAADLLKEIELICEICFVRLHSYHGTLSQGHIITEFDTDFDILDRDVIILEDIIDTGGTMKHYVSELIKMKPASIRIASLLWKEEATRKEITTLNKHLDDLYERHIH